jgi:hypothetical protein
MTNIILFLLELVNSYKTSTNVIKGCRKEGKCKILVVHKKSDLSKFITEHGALVE